MSDKALHWALRVEGLRPAPRIVLIMLADLYSDGVGCSPSQAKLAHLCGMGRSTLNDHLTLLEASGLITRRRQYDPDTCTCFPTYYRLAFDVARDGVL